MQLDPTMDVKTIAELATQAELIVQQVHQTGRPVLVTSEGQPNVVIVDAVLYDQYLATANLAELLRQGEEDIRAGRVRPIENFIAELDRGEEISS